MGRPGHWDASEGHAESERISQVPRDLQDVTPAWLAEALRIGGVADDIPVTGYTSEAIAEGKGFMNQVFRLTLEYGSYAPALPCSVIVKLPSADPMLRTIFDRFGQNRREVNFYQALSADETLSLPACYYSCVDPETEDSALLLEDMIGVRQGDSVAGCSMADARQAIGHLATIQANWWDSPRLDQLDWMPLKCSEAADYLDIYTGAWESLVYQAGAGMPPALRRLGNTLRPQLTRIKTALTRRPRTIVHGDYRLDNCFFDDAAEPTPPVVLDWEFCVRGRGVCDVATFISEAFPAQERREVERDLVANYHAVLVDHGVSAYSFKECWRDYRLAMLEIFIFWIVTGGYCNYDGERATIYLHNALARFDVAISDLGSVDLIPG